MNIHELIHAWERNALPTDSKGLQAAIETVEAYETEMQKWEKEAINIPVKSYYNFPIGICAHLKNDLFLSSAAIKASENMIIIDDVERKGGEPT